MSKRVVFISQLAEPGHVSAETFADAPGGNNEVYWVERMLDRVGALGAIDYSGRHVTRGDALPDIGAVDGVILGGSYHSVHDDRPWQRDIQKFLEEYRSSGKPLFGICGGHQQMARSFGAQVVPVDGGPMAGSLPVALTGDGRDHYLFDGLGGALQFHFANHEHVDAAPEGARVLATRPGMAAAALDYGGGWVSVQFHPEARHDVLGGCWRFSHPEYVDRYVALPQAPQMLANFLRGTGLIAG